MTKFYKSIFLFSICVSVNSANAQSISPAVVSSTGGTISNSNNMLTWTLGETVIQNIQSGNNYLSQGFQQPNYKITSLEENTSHFFSVMIFPNPSAEILNININSDYELPIKILLLDINGKIIFKKNGNTGVKQNSFICDVKNLANATYFLKIINEEKNIAETFKIQKIQ